MQTIAQQGIAGRQPHSGRQMRPSRGPVDRQAGGCGRSVADTPGHRGTVRPPVAPTGDNRFPWL